MFYTWIIFFRDYYIYNFFFNSRRILFTCWADNPFDISPGKIWLISIKTTPIELYRLNVLNHKNMAYFCKTKYIYTLKKSVEFRETRTLPYLITNYNFMLYTWLIVVLRILSDSH